MPTPNFFNHADITGLFRYNSVRIHTYMCSDMRSCNLLCIHIGMTFRTLHYMYLYMKTYNRLCNN